MRKVLHVQFSFSTECLKMCNCESEDTLWNMHLMVQYAWKLFEKLY